VIVREREESALCTVPSNNALQRSGTHKVLARGRAFTLWAGAARPRAPTVRCAAAEGGR